MNLSLILTSLPYLHSSFPTTTSLSLDPLLLKSLWKRAGLLEDILCLCDKFAHSDPEVKVSHLSTTI